MPFRLGVSMVQLWPARNSTLPLCAFTQYKRSRGTMAPFEVARFVAPLVPLKSNSLYPMKWVPFQSPSTRKPRREFCWLKCSSERLPLGTLLKGMLPKLEPMLEAAFLSRQKGVRSMNPMGTMQTLPIRRNVGMVLSGSASQGFLLDEL